jgi:hypothetical protein
MTEFSREDLENMAFCVASYTDKNGDTVYGKLLAKIRHLLKPDRMTQTQIDYYCLLEKVNGRT